MTRSNTVWTPCRSCDRDTKHNVIHETLDSEYEYRFDELHQIVECRGCETKSFRKVTVWLEDTYQVGEEEYETPESVDVYPAILKGHRRVEEINRAPHIVNKIYTQSLVSLKNECNILAGIGLRATIEAICNERNVTGRNLEARIDKMAKSGIISQNDADRLHAIRFLGNDAAHEIQPGEERGLLVALKIIEHTIINLYILDSDAKLSLETLIKDYASLEIILTEKLTTFNSGDEVPLGKILGSDFRRFHGYIRTLEAELKAAINSGIFTALTIGKVDTVSGSKDKVQYYVVV
jgi:hypothetical protein